jgi:hypothetical protein
MITKINRTQQLLIPVPLWRSLIMALRRRSKGIRESGAFLLGLAESNKIASFVLYDDLDPHCLDNGIIIFNGAGFVPLWKMCEEKHFKVLADIHTHPGESAAQSGIDKRNAMISNKGHIALIVPNYARNYFLNFKRIGIYEYLEHNKWKMWEPKSGRIKWTLR